MNEYKTLAEICKSLGVSRRAIQGYEEAGLVSAADKNKYGYLLYGEQEQARIKRIKRYQDMGFSLKEIKELIDAPSDRVKEALLQQLTKLREDKKKLETLVAEIEKIIAK